ncbi:MAG: tRNA (adenosine(37)-N6)-threonylcarbamoyltransferase complex ATPase subunit type 1 TsaE [Deltaproteobacteria bacterium]
MRMISRSVNETLRIGRSFARRLKAGDIVCLMGEFGSGKTVLAKGIASGLGIKKNEIVSPSFVLLRQYCGARLPLYHFDLYRLKSPADILGLGYEEYLYADGVTVIEWPDRLKYLLPENYLGIKLSIIGEQARTLEFRAQGQHYRQLLRQIHEDTGH